MALPADSQVRATLAYGWCVGDARAGRPCGVPGTAAHGSPGSGWPVDAQPTGCGCGEEVSAVLCPGCRSSRAIAAATMEMPPASA